MNSFEQIVYIMPNNHSTYYLSCIVPRVCALSQSQYMYVYICMCTYMCICTYMSLYGYISLWSLVLTSFYSNAIDMAPCLPIHTASPLIPMEKQQRSHRSVAQEGWSAGREPTTWRGPEALQARVEVSQGLPNCHPVESWPGWWGLPLSTAATAQNPWASTICQLKPSASPPEVGKWKWGKPE